MERLREILRQYWGYDEFRPLQAEAMRAVLDGRDSVVVLPTGGGKSLCFQAPAVAMPGLALVVSPLISLMKDQVDALANCGVPAACVNSTLSPDERRQVANQIRSGELKLLYLSPERLMTEQTLSFLRQVPLSFIAIDEAHCISDWGHDFRPEFRELRRLRTLFPEVALHAYTATATHRVRDDIAAELQLREPEILVGSFDRPNLVYRVARRTDRLSQIRAVLDRHRGESGIIYCIRRADVDQLCEELQAEGRSAIPYHAGMPDEDRRRNQDAFSKEQAETIVATVAFGMGIDKSNVRYVIHSGGPKSIEHYQQESGRAGRDGLEAECCLFFAARDFETWRRLQSELTGSAAEASATLLAGIERFCNGSSCRHQAIVSYFGQQLEADCGACDVCLGELQLVDDALIISQKVLSCVLRLQQGFGADYTAGVLTGSNEERVLERGHDKLSTWGLLGTHPKKAVRGWIEQLVDQGFLLKQGEYNLLQVTAEGRALLRGEAAPRLLEPPERPRRESKAAADSWDGVDRELFERLRAWRKEQAEERGVPPFVVFGDATLRDLARQRPSSSERLLLIHGIGERKRAEYGDGLLLVIGNYCRSEDAPLDAPPQEPAARSSPRAKSDDLPALRKLARRLISEGRTIDEIASELNRPLSSAARYVTKYIEERRITDPTTWVEQETCEQVRAICDRVGSERLKPIFEALGGGVSYEQIRIVVACREMESGDELAADDQAAFLD